jgi:hypothetical protein
MSEKEKRVQLWVARWVVGPLAALVVVPVALGFVLLTLALLLAWPIVGVMLAWVLFLVITGNPPGF